MVWVSFHPLRSLVQRGPGGYKVWGGWHIFFITSQIKSHILRWPVGGLWAGGWEAGWEAGCLGPGEEGRKRHESDLPEDKVPASRSPQREEWVVTKQVSVWGCIAGTRWLRQGWERWKQLHIETHSTSPTWAFYQQRHHQPLPMLSPPSVREISSLCCRTQAHNRFIYESYIPSLHVLVGASFISMFLSTWLAFFKLFLLYLSVTVYLHFLGLIVSVHIF
jgi:hypothetical protein